MWVKHDWKTGQENRDAGMKTDKPTTRERDKKKKTDLNTQGGIN